MGKREAIHSALTALEDLERQEQVEVLRALAEALGVAQDVGWVRDHVRLVERGPYQWPWWTGPISIGEDTHGPLQSAVGFLDVAPNGGVTV